uniref:THAP-type domain-containing protein n=1 Tax=Oncorhynchus tshawytscha TaxID=74940 RepID=A0A8C8DAC8_ONCTS
MPTSCGAIGCSNRHGLGKGLYFLPKEEHRRKFWTEAVRREKFTPSKGSALCSDHILKTDFMYNPDQLGKLNMDSFHPSERVKDLYVVLKYEHRNTGHFELLLWW